VTFPQHSFPVAATLTASPAKWKMRFATASGAPASCANRLLRRLTVAPLEAQRVEAITTFLCGRHFLRAFSSRDDIAAARTSDCRFAFPARRKHILRDLPERFFLGSGNKARASTSVARTPFASPYCPCRAQIRRLHVQPRTGLAVHPSMRVRESCLTFSPPHRHDSQNPWWSL